MKQDYKTFSIHTAESIHGHQDPCPVKQYKDIKVKLNYKNMKKTILSVALLTLLALPLFGLSANAKSEGIEVKKPTADRVCWSNHPCGVPKPTPTPAIKGGISGGVIHPACVDEMVEYGEWSSCDRTFGPGLQMRTIKSLNGCSFSTMQVVKTIRSCEVSGIFGGYGYFYGTDWLK
jgi:hypothetical protein